MKTLRSFIFILLLITFLSSCEKVLLGPEVPNNSEENFERLWQEYDRLYGSFEVKQINWDTAYAHYRPLVKPITSDRELYNILVEMLKTLDDNYVFLRPMRSTGLPPFTGGILGRKTFEDFDRVVTEKYLAEKKTYGNAITYGKLSPTIGYINLLHFSNNFNFYTQAIEEILQELKNTKGIIIEMRENDGS